MARMRLDNQTIQKLAQGFSFKLQTLSLEHNKLSFDGLKALKDQFYFGEGLRDNFEQKSRCCLWQLKSLNLDDNEINVLGLVHLRGMILCLPQIETIDLNHNCFPDESKLTELRNEIVREHSPKFRITFSEQY